MSKTIYCSHGFKVGKDWKARSCFSKYCKKGEFNSLIIEEQVTLADAIKFYGYKPTPTQEDSVISSESED